MPLQPQHAVDWLVDTLRAEPAGSVTLCSLGPLTNLAATIIKAPDVAERIGEIVLMGGGFFEGGNTKPAAEFNIYVDPHAADGVFTSGVKLTMHPLAVPHNALMPRSWTRTEERPVGNEWVGKFRPRVW